MPTARHSVAWAAGLVLAAMGCVPQAHAGAWPREKGTWFTAVTTTLTLPPDMSLVDPNTGEMTLGHYTSLYLEYGATERLAIGLDLGYGDDGTLKAIGFLRWPLGLSNDTHKLALRVGVGTVDGEAAVHPALVYGRGFTWGDRSGWFVADAQVEFTGLTPSLGTQAPITADMALKLDLTVGLNFDNGRKGIIQLQSGRPSDGDSYVRLVPSLVFPLGDTQNLEVGVSLGVVGDTDLGLKLGYWRSF